MTGFLLGLGVGLLAASAAAWWVLRRHVRVVRTAERRARAAERMAEIGAMTGGLAHEIKNPLSTIGLNAQLLAEGVEELPPEHELRPRLLNRVRALRRETERLRGILTDFLEFAGQVRLDRRDADLNDIVGELVDFYQPEADRHGVRLRADAAPSPLRASVDAKLLKQALLNLMINGTQAMAARASSPGAAAPSGDAPAAGPPAPARAGELILRTRAGVEEKRTVVRVHVIDTGPGIAPDVLPRIFDPYFTTKAGGSGLGLPTARRLIEEHGGRLDVHSEPGRGTDFTVTLPIEPPPATGAAVPRR